MMEQRHRFTARYGVFFQDCIGKTPSVAATRMRPIIALGTVAEFADKCLLAYFFGMFSRYAQSYSQVVLLVRSLRLKLAARCEQLSAASALSACCVCASLLWWSPGDACRRSWSMVPS